MDKKEKLQNSNQYLESDRDFNLEIKEILNSNKSDKEKLIDLNNYHDYDIALAVEEFTKEERFKLYNILGDERTSDVFSYLDDVNVYIEELEYDKAADIIENMDADDAIDVLEELEDEDKNKIIDLMDEEVVEDIQLIESYEEDMIGAIMTNNYISIPLNSDVKKAMKLLVQEAAENDNVYSIYVVKENDEFYGTIELRDLICARSDTDLNSIIKTSYPTLCSTDLIEEHINDLKEYALDSVPVLNKNRQLVGVITSFDILETIDEELTDDYAKLGGLSESEELNESIFKSVQKRLPWLVSLLVLSLLVSLLLSSFESVIAVLPAIVFFQSLVLGMAGNVGTQSLAVTIRTINYEEIKNKYSKTILKELRIGFLNGLILGIISFLLVFVFLYLRKQSIIEGTNFNILDTAKASLIVGIALMIAMTASSLTGTFIPIMLTKMKIDPAVASGPFITTINDILAIAIYYGLAYFLFISVF